MPMELDRGLHVERDGNTLIVRAEDRTPKWTDALFAGMGFFLFAASLTTIGRPLKNNGRTVSPDSSEYWFEETHFLVFVAIGALALIAVGVLPFLRRVFTTTFDPRSRLVVYSTCIGNRSPNTNRYSFEEIAGISLGKGHGKFRKSCIPALELKGRSRSLELLPHNVSVPAGEELIEAVRAATGLPKRDGSWWWRWW